MEIKSASFVTSYAKPGDFPAPALAEIAVAGKSNVGKSSFINGMTRQKKLAKTSQKPGKTRLVNYFLLNGAFYLVDLPGYGFAQVSKAEKERWGDMMEGYLKGSENLRHMFLLMDIRHSPTRDDETMLRYVRILNIPFTVILTKADKVAKSKVPMRVNALMKELVLPGREWLIPFSSETGFGRDRVLARMEEVLSSSSF
jgi:GTP-binding protein